MRTILLMLLVPVVMHAQLQQSITPNEAVARGLRHSRLLAGSASRADATHARAAEAEAALLPSLSLQMSYTRLSEVDPFAVTLPIVPQPVVISPSIEDQYTSRLMLRQPLFTGFALSHASAAADASAGAADHQLAQDSAEVIFTVSSAYWNLYRAQEALRVVNENVQQVEAHRADLEALMQQGMATTNDLLRVDVQLSAARLAAIDAANKERSAAMALNILTGLPPDAATGTVAADLAAASLPDAGPLDAMLASRPDLQAGVLRADAARRSAQAAAGAFWPQIQLTASLVYANPNPRVMPAKDEFKGTWDIGIGLSWDIWNWGATSRRHDQAAAVQLQAEAALDQLRDIALLEARQAQMNVEHAAEKIRVAALGAAHADAHHQVTRSRMTEGTATSTDLLDAEVALLQARLQQASARAEYEIALAAHARATGRSGATAGAGSGQPSNRL